MRQTLLLALLAVTAYFYFHNSASPGRATVSAQPASTHVAAQPVIIAAATSSSYASRWKTGPNAQTDFEPFVPCEQATWNRTPGYTIVGGGGSLRLR